MPQNLIRPVGKMLVCEPARKPTTQAGFSRMTPGAKGKKRLTARRVAVLLVGLTSLLAGCERHPDSARTNSTIAASVIADPSDTTIAPTTAPATSMPNWTDDEQAIQAVSRFYEELNRSLRTLATGNLRAVFRPGCLACQAGADKIDQTARASGIIVGGNYTIANLLI